MAYKKITLAVSLLFFSANVYMHNNQNNILYAFGSGSSGQLGIGYQTNKNIPTLVKSIKNLKDIDARKSISAAITSQGKIYTWGKSSRGNLGLNLQRNVNIMLPSEILQNNVRFKQISCGYQHMAAVTQDGYVYIWGDSQLKLLGKQIKLQKKQFRQTIRKSPLYVEGIPPMKIQTIDNIQQVSCGQKYTLALNKNGQVFSWGQNYRGSLGRQGNELIPMKIKGLQNIVKIHTGIDYSMALDKDGKQIQFISLYGWGNNMYSQLGSSTLRFTQKPIIIGDFQGKVIDFSCGSSHSGAVNQKGQCFTWGIGSQGQLGHKQKMDICIPKKLQTNQKVQKIICGGEHSAYLTQDGNLFMFGRGRQGQLGLSQKDQSSWIWRAMPKCLQFFKGKHILKVVLGGQHTMVLVKV